MRNKTIENNNVSIPAFLSVIVFCLFPFFLNLLGVDFSSHAIPLPEQRTILLDDLFFNLSGSFTHTILEWSAFTVAIMVALLGFVHFRVAREAAIPVICIALFCAGSMDAFHTLAADRLIEAVADNTKLIPFTWAISRSFNALIIITGISLFLLNPQLNKKTGISFIVLSSLLFITVAFFIINYCATSNNLPITIYPDAIITRPWDVVPLLLYSLFGIPLLSQFNKQYPSTFSQALLLSMIPEIVVELHMAFASKALFDNDFNIAHFLKIFAYLIPGIGLLIDYIQTYTRLEHTSNLLYKEKTKNKSIIDNALFGIILLNETGHIQSFNPASKRLFRYQEKDVIDKHFNILMLEPYPEQQSFSNYFRKYKQSLLKTSIGLTKETMGQRKNGESFPLELGISEIKLENKPFFICFIRDLSHRKHLENTIKYREQLFSTFVDAAPVMMWMLDINNKPLMFNKTWLDFTGHTLEQELSHQWNESQVHPNDQKRVMKTYFNALSQHIEFDHEYQMQRYNGDYRWIREIGIPHQENNIYKGYIGICLDITQKKTDEINLRNHTQELERSNAELEQFAYIASHDLQEPLRMVSSYTQLLARRYQDKLDDDANEFIGYAVDGANRMQTLIQDLLAFSRVGKNKQSPKPINISQLIQNVLIGLKIVIEESNALITYPESFPEIIADHSQCQQLFQNLIFNAIKYRSEDRQCKININCESIDNMWQFSIQDNGIGVKAEFFERIFVIFKRLHGKEKYSGTGIGLAICKRIVEGHGGQLWLESEFGSGSTFYFTCPFFPEKEKPNS